jgi:hypothetical protein
MDAKTVEPFAPIKPVFDSVHSVHPRSLGIIKCKFLYGKIQNLYIILIV